MSRVRTAGAVLGAAALLAGCNAGGASGASGSSDTAPTLRVQTGGQDVRVSPTQYCLDGDGQRYTSTPPIIEVSPDSTIGLTVAGDVAEQGWSVQVFDDQLDELIGEVDVDSGTGTFTGINSSDVAPAAFYLVVVEDSDDGDCNGLSGAWPVGFVRSGETAPTDGSTPTPTG
ncbi:DUF2771 family protein [Modestobacter sp. Leaf380]|uniref:DUF2771 family protein n=1 Tax=Modestobacter sp. Leaf380 TaxID=1736356 RepID=UPI0006F4970D|nr:DUF2771 family protein [Modestobacter sp. Leaf380]KQS68966.1 hypothetical protein ASG41_06070 [Modestobacter sp. Leaf380]